MHRFRLLLVATLVVTFGSLGLAPAAQAAQTAKGNAAVSFVGTYKLHQAIGGMWQAGTMKINADGTAVDQFKQVGQWTSKGKSFTMNFSNSHITEQFTAVQTTRGIGSKKKLGTLMTTLGNGYWYAVRKG